MPAAAHRCRSVVVAALVSAMMGVFGDDPSRRRISRVAWHPSAADGALHAMTVCGWRGFRQHDALPTIQASPK